MKNNRNVVSVIYSLFLTVCLTLSTGLVNAGTVAYWRFEEGPAGSSVAHTTASGVFEAAVLDSSGSGNHLSVWDTGGAGFNYRTDVPMRILPGAGLANNYSVKNNSSWPAMWTASTAMQTWSPTAWTIEVAFQPELTDSYRTLVGRDSRGTATINGDLSALYLQIQPDESLAIKFCDVNGYWHEAISQMNLVQGFSYSSDPDGLTGQWQAAAAVCDGSTLSLYYRDIELNGGWDLVAQTDLTLSGSPGTALTAGAGGAGDWDAGNWSVGRGLYAGGHGDRAWGFIDEVRISDSARTVGEFLMVPEPSLFALAMLGGVALFGRRFARR